MKISTPFLVFITLMTTCASQVPEKDIVLINIGELDREGIAEEISILNSFKPKVLAVDILFAEREPDEKDAKLATALRKCENCLMPSFVNKVGGVTLISYGQQIFQSVNTRYGFINVNLENDPLKTLKSFIVWEQESHEDFITGLKKIEYHFSVQAAMMYDSTATMKFISSNPQEIHIDYKKGKRNFKKILTDDVLGMNLKKSDIEGKIVILGYLGPNDEDKFFTPLNKSNKEPDMYGAEYLANVIAQILESANERR